MDTSATKIQLIIGVAVVVIVAILVYFFTQTPSNTADQTVVQTSPQSIEGCYVVRREQAVYTMKIEEQRGTQFIGTLAYQNFEMDSSSGPFEGTYINNILLGYYAFTAEGTNSIRQVIFKKVGDSFVQGFGPVRTEGNREVFINPATVTFDPALTFTLSKDCS